MEDILEIHISRAQHCHVDAMAHVFLNSFDLDGSVKIMYTKDEIGPVIQTILHDCMNDDRIEFKLAVDQDSGSIVGWMSFGIIPAEGTVPEFASTEMTTWAAQKLRCGDAGDPRQLLAAQLEERSRDGQVIHMPSNRLVINTIVTDPEYRRRGGAGRLLKCAVEHARSVVSPIWAQTPSVYEGLFWRYGFHAVGNFGLDLNEFQPPGEVAVGMDGRQLGVQTWRQMKLKVKQVDTENCGCKCS